MRLLTYPADQVLLRRKARPIVDGEWGTDALEQYGARLAKLMMDVGGLGLAATQVDEELPAGGAPAMFAMRIEADKYAVFCNPEIIHASGSEAGLEGCLSFASVLEVLAAPSLVNFAFRNLRGVVGQVVFADLMARIVAHECAHLDGKLLIDRMSSGKRSLFMKRVTKAQPAHAARLQAAAPS